MRRNKNRDSKADENNYQAKLKLLICLDFQTSKASLFLRLFSIEEILSQFETERAKFEMIEQMV